MKKFLLIFFGSFFITLFIFMMQFTWRIVDELVGKGLSISILADFFRYMAITLVPMSLPPAVLLASLISFGNMGEKLELLAMKAAGIPLWRIMTPVFILTICITGISFYFQNESSPAAQLNLRSLLYGMKESSPVLEIPEGVFYNDIPSYSIYVAKKNIKTGKLYNMMLYKVDQGFDKAQIVLADSAKLTMTKDKLHLILDIWNGEQSQNLESGNMGILNNANNPFDRETFLYKRFIIDFDSNFAKLDADQLRNMASAKNLKQIDKSLDSMNLQLDSIGKANYNQAKINYFNIPQNIKESSTKQVQQLIIGNKINFDSILVKLPAEKVQNALQQAKFQTASYASTLEWKSMTTDDAYSFIRKHLIEWHKKFTISLACLFFFLVGAPLGAIIRKGGLGLPSVISVLIFILYYIIDTAGMKMARTGSWNMIYGMWISSAILFPIGVFLTYKANKDSAVFNIEIYINFMKRFVGLRSKRHMTLKEVVIYTPNYENDARVLKDIAIEAENYLKHTKRYNIPNYIDIFFKTKTDNKIQTLNIHLKEVIEDLSNTRNNQIIYDINQIPYIQPSAHIVPFRSKTINQIVGALFPFGILLWGRIWRFRIGLYGDLKQLINIAKKIAILCETENEKK